MRQQIKTTGQPLNPSEKSVRHNWRLGRLRQNVPKLKKQSTAKKVDPSQKSADPKWYTKFGSRLAVVFICMLAGFLIGTARSTADGEDLRPDRNTDLLGLVTDRADRAKELRQYSGKLRTQVDKESKKAASQTGLNEKLGSAEINAMIPAVKGPGIKVVLDDAPNSIAPSGVDQDLLVVHEQDIRAVINALWQGGGEAVMVQNQRIISTTGIKCVGNTVILNGIPYAPPYEIVAVGDQKRMEQALASSEKIQVYQQYAARYDLGYQQENLSEATVVAYQGSLEVGQAILLPEK